MGIGKMGSHKRALDSCIATLKMEAMKMKVFAVLMVVLMAFSAMQEAAAADAPAPSPTSDATIFVPTFLASLVALAFGVDDGAFNYDCVRRHDGHTIDFEGMALAYHVKVKEWFLFPNS
ncbi:hypothetical protein SADUNF_Sadunf01G0003500 [Salix dunnii]|uniref:Uncharacterized protein n=1 Tax=Salix dunnii TaxID=1413687 RepID=A0A835N976_9ROSI|nr:hypothetical protein SADUNF_Sadunf01G0003500 [Salix dunnii]